MRKIKTVKMELDGGESKEFTIKEMTVQNILDLSQNNAFFKAVETGIDSATKKSQNGEDADKIAKEVVESKVQKTVLGELGEMRDELTGVMKLTCDFTLQDLTPLAPSEIKELFNEFQEVNQVFLDVLRRLKILDVFLSIVDRALSNFSKMLAIL